MVSSRFFVTNLPTDATGDDLRFLFKNYGPVTLIDLKTKENALEPGNVNVFAFVTLEINAEDAEYCLDELKWQKLRGAKIKITLAKESFLERLKRERAENETGVNNENISTTDEFSSPKVTDPLPQSSQNTRRVFNEDEELNDDDIAPELLITKKRAARSIQNGKIVIEECGAGPLHVIEKPKKTKKGGIASTTTLADQKRKESLNKMKNQYQQKKNAIQEALSGENGQKSKKIKFSDAEEEDEDDTEENKTKSKTQIFGSDDEDEDLNTLNVHYGKKGDKLAALQSERQNLDPRFKIDEKFVDEDGNTGENNKKEEDENEDDERKWQLNILEQVVGYKLDTETVSQKAAKNKKMLRFDPSKAEHQKLLREKPTESLTESQSKKKMKSTEKENQNAEGPAVSKEVFYVVSDTLTEALKTRGEGFSLLNMFGQQAASAELEQREDQLKKLKDEKIFVNKMSKNAASALNYESSSSGEDDDDIPASKKPTEVNTEKQQQNISQNSSKKTKTTNILVEMFFFTKNDERLKEGAKFFQFDQTNQIADEDYEPVRRRLNMLIKKKISKTRKNLIGSGRKAKRNKKKA